MANEDLGEIKCGYHVEPVDAVVRRDKKGKLYIYCPECGIISPRNAKFQSYIENNMTAFNVEPVPEKEAGPVARPEPEKEAAPVTRPEPEKEAAPVAKPEPEKKPDDLEEWMK